MDAGNTITIKIMKIIITTGDRGDNGRVEAYERLLPSARAMEDEQGSQGRSQVGQQGVFVVVFVFDLD